MGLKQLEREFWNPRKRLVVDAAKTPERYELPINGKELELEKSQARLISESNFVLDRLPLGENPDAHFSLCTLTGKDGLHCSVYLPKFNGKSNLEDRATIIFRVHSAKVIIEPYVLLGYTRSSDRSVRGHPLYHSVLEFNPEVYREAFDQPRQSNFDEFLREPLIRLAFRYSTLKDVVMKTINKSI